MSNLPELNFPAFHAAAAALRAQGHEVVNPAEINADPTAGWYACMRADIAQLVTCQVIALLPGWRRSRGAKLERYIADSLGMACVTLPKESRGSSPGRSKGGHARAAKLSPERRSEIAKLAASQRWSKHPEVAASTATT